VAREVAFGALLDPIAALDRSATVLRSAVAGRSGWAPQPRDGRGLPWREALRRFGPHTAAGLLLGALFAAASPFAALAALPALAGLVLAVPLAVLTARPADPGARSGAQKAPVGGDGDEGPRSWPVPHEGQGHRPGVRHRAPSS
jgi:membrane glycosyltransferase